VSLAFQKYCDGEVGTWRAKPDPKFAPLKKRFISSGSVELVVQAMVTLVEERSTVLPWVGRVKVRAIVWGLRMRMRVRSAMVNIIHQ
jgi:hypothetical protein